MKHGMLDNRGYQGSIAKPDVSLQVEVSVISSRVHMRNLHPDAN